MSAPAVCEPAAPDAAPHLGPHDAHLVLHDHVLGAGSLVDDSIAVPPLPPPRPVVPVQTTILGALREPTVDAAREQVELLCAALAHGQPLPIDRRYRPLENRIPFAVLHAVAELADDLYTVRANDGTPSAQMHDALVAAGVKTKGKFVTIALLDAVGGEVQPFHDGMVAAAVSLIGKVQSLRSQLSGRVRKLKAALKEDNEDFEAKVADLYSLDTWAKPIPAIFYVPALQSTMPAAVPLVSDDDVEMGDAGGDGILALASPQGGAQVDAQLDAQLNEMVSALDAVDAAESTTPTMSTPALRPARSAEVEARRWFNEALAAKDKEIADLKRKEAASQQTAADLQKKNARQMTTISELRAGKAAADEKAASSYRKMRGATESGLIKARAEVRDDLEKQEVMCLRMLEEKRSLQLTIDDKSEANRELRNEKRKVKHELEAAKKELAVAAIQEKALKDELAVAWAESKKAESESEELKRRIAALEKLTRAGAADEIARANAATTEARRELAAAQRQTAIANAKRATACEEEKRMRKQFKQTQSALDGLRETNAARVKELKRGGGLQMVRIETEEDEALRTQVGELERINAALKEENAELAKVVNPSKSKFYWPDMGGRYALPVVTSTLLFMAENGLTAKYAYSTLAASAQLFGVNLPTRQQIFPGTSKVARHVEERYMLPSESTCQTICEKAIIFDDINNLLQLMRVCAANVQNGKCPVIDSGIWATGDSAHSGLIEYHVVNLHFDIDGVRGQCCLSMSPCANASSEAKVKHVIAAVKRLSYVANVLMRRCPWLGLTPQIISEICNMASIQGWTSDKGAADWGASQHALLVDAKRDGLRSLLALRFLSMKRAAVARLLAVDGHTAEVDIIANPTLEAADLPRVRAALAKHNMAEIITSAVNAVLSRKPPVSDVGDCLSLAILLESEKEPGERHEFRRAARPDADGKARTKFDASISDYQTKALLADRVEYVLNAGLAVALVAGATTEDVVSAMVVAANDGSSYAADVARRAKVRCDAGAQTAASDEHVQTIGTFLLGAMHSDDLELTLSSEREYCKEHGLVNTVKYGEDAASKWVVTALGEERLREIANLLHHGKAKSPDACKWKTNVWFFGSPVWHFLYRLAVLLAPFSTKEWSHGQRFYQWLLEKKYITVDEYRKMKKMASICGNRDGIFWYECWFVAKYLHFIQEYLKAQEEHLDKNVGKTIVYCAAMAAEGPVHTVCVVCGALYYGFYIPLIAAAEHIGDGSGMNRRKIREHDQAVYLKLLEWTEDPIRFMRGDPLFDGRDVAPEFEDMREKMCVRREVGGCVTFEPDKQALEVCGLIMAELARGHHHYNKESMLGPHGVDVDDQEAYDAAFEEFFKKGGGSALDLSDAQVARGRNAQATSKMPERVFSTLRRVRLKSITRGLRQTSGLTRVKHNHSAPQIHAWVMSLSLEQQMQVDAAVLEIFAADKKHFGNAATQLAALGAEREVLVQAKRAHRQAVEAKFAAECARLQALRAELGEPVTWAVLAEWAKERAADLHGLVKAFRDLDNKEVPLMGALGSKHKKLEELVKQYALSVSAEEIALAAGSRAAAGRRAGGSSRNMSEVEMIVGARTVDGDHQYEVRWRGYGEEYDSWLRYSDIAPADSDGMRSTPHPDIRAQVLEFDAVRADELARLDEMAAQFEAVADAELTVADRVIADYQEADGTPAWLAGEFIKLASDGTARVKLDDGRMVSLPRDDVLRVESAPSFDFEDCDIVKAPMDDETVPDTAKYWSYGKVLGWTSERRELIIVQFDEDDVNCPITMPPFEIVLVHRPPQRPAKRRKT